MYFFTPDTIAQANKNIEALDSKFGGLLCVLHCLTENIEENVSYTIDGEKLRKQLSFVFDKEPRDSFDNAKPSYIIFAKDWVSTFFENCIENKVDLLSCAVFFLRRQGFEREYTKDEVIDLFVKRFNLKNIKDLWFGNNSKLEPAYNQNSVEENQSEFYANMDYVTSFKSILFKNTIQKYAYDLKAAGHIQTLYSGSIVQKCFLLSDEPLDRYYIMSNICQNSESQGTDAANNMSLCGTSNEDLTMDDLADILKNMYNNPEHTGKAMTPMIFGFKYAEVIENNKYSISAMLDKITVPDSYEVEIKKGMNLYNAIKNGEYGLSLTIDVLSVGSISGSVDYCTNVSSVYPHNRIIFGAPGTGKSFTLNKEMRSLVPNDESFERVTFHPDYSYANFVGTYKPVPDGNGITYSFVAGPFIRTWIKAIKSAQNFVAQPYVLLIEEINRANVAAVFGDVFQLLDRDENGVSEYSIQTSKELREYLAKELNCTLDDVASIRIPNNMFIWATMNSADQGVFPMDTAFKRRWDFKYLGIDDSQDGIKNYELNIAGQTINWNKLRQAINDRLSALNINEDKLIGPYFINEKTLKDNVAFIEAFKSKVLMYLFEDAAKQRRAKVFYQDGLKYSELCKKFDTDGVKVFSSEIYKNLINTEETE